MALPTRRRALRRSRSWLPTRRWRARSCSTLGSRRARSTSSRGAASSTSAIQTATVGHCRRSTRAPTANRRAPCLTCPLIGHTTYSLPSCPRADPLQKLGGACGDLGVLVLGQGVTRVQPTASAEARYALFTTATRTLSFIAVKAGYGTTTTTTTGTVGITAGQVSTGLHADRDTVRRMTLAVPQRGALRCPWQVPAVLEP